LLNEGLNGKRFVIFLKIINMGKQIPVSVSFSLPDGREVSIETGKLASLADGSVVVKVGKTMLLCTVVSSKEAKPGQSFFPLSVDYQEKFAAVGRIPGNFFKREARLSDYEILISRLVDRAVRPLFPDGYMNETQIIINLISGEVETLPDCYAALAASAALTISDIPFAGPISEVRVARIDGQFTINPSKSDLGRADLDLIVAASEKDIMMVEGEGDEVQEKDMIEAIKFAHSAIKTQIQAQKDLIAALGEGAGAKREIPAPVAHGDLEEFVVANATEPIKAVVRKALDKTTRAAEFKEIRDQIVLQLTEERGEEFGEDLLAYVKDFFDKHKKETIRNVVLEESIRLDGRSFTQVRPIWCEIDYLPSAHGSAIFNRGETQSLTSLTLGTKLDEQMIDIALGTHFEKFILHYNFPAFSVGEVRPMRGPGRREVGHANLAGRSIKKIMPKGFPYTVRLVSDILESNGSSSMATVCASSLALMDGGVQIREHVAGIAMGMISDGKKFAILSDILGDEDALGDMDFKVTGTSKGITACQMDIKIDGLPYEQMENALNQAKEGRMHILSIMNQTISQPAEDLKPHAPRMVELRIPKSFIGAVIGPGGSIIQEMQAVTGTTITITEVGDEGVVNISSANSDGIKEAVAKIHEITFEPSVGDEYDAVVASIMPYGVFVDFKGKSGLLHVSEISYERIENVEDVFKEGDKVRVKLLEVDKKTGKFRLSSKALLPKPEGYTERPPRSQEDRASSRRPDHRDRDRDRGKGGDRR
jgi:polyribonucleotide nucleotidyltransferase